jgi:hypothetical protein
MHPWEFDPKQPFLHDRPLLKRTKHHIAIGRKAYKARRLTRELLKDGYEFRTVTGYMGEAT